MSRSTPEANSHANHDAATIPVRDYEPPHARRPAYGSSDVPIRYEQDQQPSLIAAALARHWPLVMLLSLLLAGGGVALGVKRKPTWTAKSTLQIGANINPNSPTYAGFAQSVTNLATTFSRAIDANGVLRRVQATTGIPPSLAARRITATPVPNAAAMDVIATGPTEPSAISLSNAAAKALVASEAPSNFSNSATRIYGELRHEQGVAAQARGDVQRLEAQVNRNNPNAPFQNHPDLVKANADLAAVQSRVSALSAAYTQAVQAEPSTQAILTPLAGAVTASSDRKHKIELYGFAGLAIGFLLAAMIAILREQRRRIRHSSAAPR